jgi:hypothetical protein
MEPARGLPAGLRMSGVHGGDPVNAWATGYAAGDTRGRRDGNAEVDGTYTRSQEPVPVRDDEEWVDGFLTGYAHGREHAMRDAS